MIDEKAASKIHDDAREKIAEIYPKGCVLSGHSCKYFEHSKCVPMLHNGVSGVCREQLDYADQILNLSGTTDIKCPECLKGMIMPPVTDSSHLGCGRCHGENVIKHKWKIAVVLENGELPKLISLTGEASIEEKSAYLLGTKDEEEQMLNKGYRQVVK